MGGWLQIIVVTILLAGCASVPQTEPLPLPADGPPAKAKPERRAAPRRPALPEPVAAVDEENNVFFKG
jgi:hypothetical protein